MSNLIRIEKYLGQEGIMSRREAKRQLQESKPRIFVNGKKAHAGQKIDPEHDSITLSEKAQERIENLQTVAVYKPRGVLSSHDEVEQGKNIFDTFPQYQTLSTVGRLDKESEGLILLSNDGRITRAVTGKHHPIEKEYEVVVRETIAPWMMKKMSQGMEIEDGWTLPAQANKIDIHTYRIVLREGRKHQIRRMANACKLTIESLKRIRIHSIRLGNMLPGNYKAIDENTLEEIRSLG